MNKNLVFFTTGIFLSLVIFCPALNSQSADKVGSLLEKLTWRCVGPAAMGGRTTDIEAVEKEPWTIYAAVGPSGVWKSDNNGITWSAVFHEEGTVSVGDIAITQSHPEIIWVGTGEATCRNSVTIGDGVYKSIDSGKTWKNMGLKESRHISRIIVDPDNPDVVYVAAMGHLWGPNSERGIYRTADGGESWKQVLFVNKDTGFADLAIDPSDTQILYAAAYEHRRLPFIFSSGGPGSGLYKSKDGGESWIRLTKDLPEGVMGRIGLAVSRSNPDVVYALIEHKDGGIWRSEDKGQTWKRMCDNETYMRVNMRPFYYSQIRVDPTNDKIVYVLSGGLFVSKDMGKTFKAISQGTHPDHHALWVDPNNPQHLIDGNDGGIDITYDGGKNWQAIQHMTLAEVYQIGFDMRNPYFVYCGLQDNGLWGGPSATYASIGITNDDWYVVGAGDGFYAQVDPADVNTVYGNYQINGLYRFDLRSGQSKAIRPYASLKGSPYRFNWNSPIHISPHDSKTVYTGGNYLFRSSDRGQSWIIISPDLSTNDPEKQKDSGGSITRDNSGAEVHCTIYTISESPAKRGVIWCGTDDGNVQVTEDGGKSWKNVVRNIPGLPSNTWCSRIEASRFKPGTAYVAFDGHRHDDYNAYLYKTTDFGETWTSIKGNLPFGWIHVIREDKKNENLLFVGTEFGVYASLDRGESWFSLQNNLPTVAVRDIAVHPRENDLIIGTHGRGIWIMDDITPLQEMNEAVFESAAHLFSIRPAIQFFPTDLYEPLSKPVYVAKNPPYGMIITSYFKTKSKERPTIIIKNKTGEQIFKMNLLTKEGVQRKEWNLRYLPKTKEGIQVKPPAGIGFIASPFCHPDEYSVELEVDGLRIEQKGTVLYDPFIQIDEANRKAQNMHMVAVIRLSEKMGALVTSIKNIRRQLDKLNKSIKDIKDTSDLSLKSLKDFEMKFHLLEEEVLPKGIGYLGSWEMALRGGTLSDIINFMGYTMGTFPFEPTEADVVQLQDLSENLKELTERMNRIIIDDIPRLNDILKEHGLKTFRAPKEITT